MSFSATRRASTGFDRRHCFGKLWPRWSWTAEKLNWNARYLAWLEEYGIGPAEDVFANRTHMFEFLCPRAVPISYLEFGVYKGESLGIWSKLNQHPDSRFHGFDSWEGLAGEEGAPFDAGQFQVDRMPSFVDTRIKLHKGWFTETLPKFREEITNRPLIINIDSDLYSSALYVLTKLDPGPGTIIMLDEASVAHCEFRALLDWSQSYGRKYRVLAGWRHGRRVEGVAVEVIG